jgi:preprotein translocase subunit SecD
LSAVAFPVVSCKRPEPLVIELILQAPRAEDAHASVDILRKRLNSLEIHGTVEPLSASPEERSIRVLLPALDDLAAVNSALVDPALFQVSAIKGGPFGSREEALNSYRGVLPNDVSIAPEETPAQSGTRSWYAVGTSPQLENRDLESISAEPGLNDSQWRVSFTLKRDASQRFANYTQSHIGDRVALTLDGAVHTAPTIQSRIDGKAEVSGMTEADAKRWAVLLKSGSLPAKLEILEERVRR